MGQCQDTALAAGPGVISPALNCTAKQAVLAGILVPHGKTSDQRTRGGCVKEPRQWQDPSACTHSSAQELRDGTGTGRDSAGTADGRRRDGQAQLRQAWPWLGILGSPSCPPRPPSVTITAFIGKKALRERKGLLLHTKKRFRERQKSS